MAKTIKKITSSKDLEGVKPLEEVKVTYRYDPSGVNLPCISEGIYAGSFDVNNQKYLAVAKIKSSNYNTFVTSVLYKADENAIFLDKPVLNGDCTANDPSSLEEKIKKHLNIFMNDKLEELKRMRDKSQMNKFLTRY
ncbi:MAG: hypothetical protein NTZ83_04155 [Candidatus Pacearchaeota archaeon]|nr:hypothetical protein [Candidatus Pacearchaeota archaeon]